MARDRWKEHAAGLGARVHAKLPRWRQQLQHRAVLRARAPTPRQGRGLRVRQLAGRAHAVVAGGVVVRDDKQVDRAARGWARVEWGGVG